MLQASPDSVWGEFVSRLRDFLRPDASPDACLEALAGFVRRHMRLEVLAAMRGKAKEWSFEHGVWCADAFCSAGVLRSWLVSEQAGLLLDTLQELAVRDGAERWEEQAITGLPPELRPVLFWTALPIPGSDLPHGLVMAGKAREAGPWTEMEKRLIFCCTSLLGLFFQGKQHGEIDARMLHAIMDHAGMGIYITDPATDVILYMNRPMKELFQLRNPEGKICWKVLQVGRDRRCEYCPLPLLLSHTGKSFVYRWEERNTLTGKIFEKFDSLIPWVDGSVVHLQQSMDISGSRHLIQASDTDGLPGRLSGLAALSHSLDEARTGGLPLVISMLEPLVASPNTGIADGTGEAERVCALISGLLVNGLEMPNFAFRYSETIFTLVFHGINRYAASQMMEELIARIRHQMEAQAFPDIPRLCHGLFEVPSGHDLAPAEVLSNTDQNLYEQKRHLRIGDKFRHLREERPAGIPSSFSCEGSQLFDALVASTEEYLFVWDVTTDTLRWSPSITRAFDLPGEIMENGLAAWGMLIHPDERQTVMEACQTVMDGRTESLSMEYRVRNRRNEWVRVRERGHLERDAAGKPKIFAGFVRPLEKCDKIDPVTGLYNKIKLEEDITRLLEANPDRSLTLLVLGVDGFKQINDLYDRLFGDEILRRIGQKIVAMLPRHAVAYRLDSDEFGIILRSGRADAQHLYRSLAAGFRFQQEHDGRKYSCTLSAGSASCPDDADNCSDLLQCAGSALRRSKVGGRDRLTFFDPAFISERKRSLELLELLRESMEHNYAGFSLVYQPQVAVDTCTITGAEVLTRWRCEKYGMVSPAEFVPLLEQSGLIVPFGKWLFRKAAEQCRKWIVTSPNFVLSVNLSYLQVASDDMLPFIRNTLKFLKLAPTNLTLEFTESCMIGENARIHTIFGELRRLGLHIAMDDFGTGYSSLGMLKDAPADVVKIDRVFVRDILHSRFDATFIRFVVALCHDVGIRVCLEGVERNEELELVRSMHLDYIQGYLFGKPVDPATFEQQFLRPGKVKM